MNYSTSIAYNTRKGELEPATMNKLFTVKEIHIKILAVTCAACCSALVYVLQHL
jgi:hypothetical protein